MGSITDLDTFVSLATGSRAQFINAWKDPTGAATIVTSRHTSLWQYQGHPSGGAAPGGTARNPTNATAGSLMQADPTGGRSLWLTGWHVMSRAQGRYVLYDRLADISGLSGTSTGAQSITGLSVTRYTGTASVGNEIWLEINTAIGGTATTVSASYTNQAGTSGKTTPLVTIGGAGFQEAQRMLRLPLASGDTGVRSVESITLTATTGTTGDIGVVIGRRLAICQVPINMAIGVADLSINRTFPVEIKAGACLALINLTNTTVASFSMHGFAFMEV